MSGISVYSTNSSSRKLLSTHGVKLLNELSTPYFLNQTENNKNTIERCIKYINLDKNAGKLKNDIGNTAFHLLVGRDFDEEFILPILKALVEKCPEGAKIKNDEGSLPLHLALSSPIIFEEVACILLRVFPESASIVNPEGLTPLLLSTMRDNSSFELCKMLCQLYSKGPQIHNKTRSLPLHFACKRAKPNIKLLQMLLRRFPDGAKAVNSYGLLPLHCICMSTDDLDAVKLVYDSYPAAVEVKELAGKTCLHLAVLNIGREHCSAVAKEVEDEARKKKNNDDDNDDDDNDDDSDDSDDDNNDDNNTPGSHNIMQEKGRNRSVIQFLISAYPLALVTKNNFNAIPVETVLEKHKPLRTKKKEVTIYGLYDDPPTARLLLISQYIYARKLSNFSDLKRDHMGMLKELNWIVRKDAVYTSIVGEPRPSSQEYKILKQVKLGLIDINNITNKNSNKNTIKQTNQKNMKNKKNLKAINVDDEDITNIFNQLTLHDDKKIPKDNILARLRTMGFLDVVKKIILYI